MTSNSCPKCGSTKLYKGERVTKCKSCKYSNSPTLFSKPEESDNLLKRFGFCDCWNCHKNFPYEELRELDDKSTYLCNGCFKVLSSIVRTVLQGVL